MKEVKMFRKWIVDISSVIIMVISTPLLLVAKMVNNPAFSLSCAKLILRPINWFAGNNYTIHNIEYLKNNDNYVLISNHLSGFDLVTLGLIADKPVKFIAQSQLSIIPIASQWFELLGTIFIDQEDPKECFKAIEAAIKALKRKENIGIFPAGTIWEEPLPFKEGGIKIAQKTKTTIIPLTIYNTRLVFEDRINNDMVNTEFYFHKPLTYEDYKDMTTDEITKELEKMIYQKYEEYRDYKDINKDAFIN